MILKIVIISVKLSYSKKDITLNYSQIAWKLNQNKIETQQETDMDPEQDPSQSGGGQGEDSEQFGTEQGGDYFDGDDEQVDLMDGDVDGDMASSDSELQVQDPSQEINENDLAEEENNDPMNKYIEKENQILNWIESHPGQKWVDFQFPCNSSQFYDDPANLPPWGSTLKNLEWKRPDEIIKDPKFMIIEEDKQGRIIQIDAKHGVFAASWFIGALTMAGTKPHIIEKLIIEKDYFDKGFVSFQFFKNGSWTQVVVDTLLPYEKQHNARVCLYSCCANPQEFWIQLLEKAYVKLHKNYENICRGSIIEGLVDLTGGVSEPLRIAPTQEEVIDPSSIWSSLLNFFQQKFLLGCINTVEGKELRNAEQGQQGILENHYYTILDMRDFPKDNLKLVRLRNPWGNEGVWTGAFCEEADDWEKYKAVKEELKNVPKTKKIDGSWWMSFPDFLQQFDRVAVGKIFPDSWEMYSIEGEWMGKTNGGRCPTNLLGDKTTFMDSKEFKDMKDYIQFESDDRWFNNPQFRIKVNKDTRLYISLMQEDDKISGQGYVPVSFMIAATKSKSERIWERPQECDIVAEVNASGAINNSRELTHYLTLKKHEGKEKIPKMYMIIPNIVDLKDVAKKDDPRKFYLRLLSPDPLDVSELPQTLESVVEGQWAESTAGGSRKIEIKEDGNGKKKGDIKDNPNWCKNPQYFLTFNKPTMMKIILRKTGFKKFKGWKIGMTICRFQGCDENGVRFDKSDKNLGNLQKLLKQTDQFLQPPVLNDVERKLIIQSNENFKESMYFSEEVSALFFKWNPTEGPFIIIPSSDGEDRCFGYKLTIYSNNPVNLMRLDDNRNQVIIGKWEKDISAGGCHLNELQKEVSQRTWSMNPKYLLTFKEEDINEEPIRVRVTLTIAERNWKKLNPNTVNGMIGLYLLDRPEGKLFYNKDTVVNQTNFLPVKQIIMETILGGENSMPVNPSGYVIMPSTYQSKVQGTFIVSVKCDRPFELSHFK